MQDKGKQESFSLSLSLSCEIQQIHPLQMDPPLLTPNEPALSRHFCLPRSEILHHYPFTPGWAHRSHRYNISVRKFPAKPPVPLL